MTEKKEPTQLDLKLAHTVGVHMLEEAYLSLIIALEETYLVSADARFITLREELLHILDLLMKTASKTLDTIPGVLSQEEAEALLDTALQHAALLRGLPADGLRPDKEVLQ